jgi:hypothetical protein
MELNPVDILIPYGTGEFNAIFSRGNCVALIDAMKIVGV